MSSTPEALHHLEQTTPPAATQSVTDPAEPTQNLRLTGRLVLVSNREPYTVKVGEDAVLQLKKTAGGLVSALDPVLRQNKGLWICWAGTTGVDEVNTDPNAPPSLNELTEMQHEAMPYDICTVPLTRDEVNHYYYGYANTRIWPLFHYFSDKCDFFQNKDWPSYQSANEKFAQTITDNTSDDDLIWIHDYHLFLVPGLLRDKAPNRQIAFFCHIPFPDRELFRLLPSRQTLLRGMLGSNLIGFHTQDYVDHFLECVEDLLPAEEVRVDWRRNQVEYQGRRVQIGAFPISIDTEAIRKLTDLPEVQEEAHQLRTNFHTPILGLGVDRLDYTKGILERLETIRVLLEKYPQYRKRLTFVQIASPTRTEVAMYRDMKESVEQTVGRINGMFGEDGWVPIHYYYRSFSMRELMPYFRAADFALINPLRDGMNLVAKEYCVARTDNQGLLVLSELTGAASELKEALIVNPYHLEGVADTVDAGLQLSDEEKRERMSRLRAYILEHDIHWWVKSFLESFDHVVHHAPGA